MFDTNCDKENDMLDLLNSQSIQKTQKKRNKDVIEQLRSAAKLALRF